MSSSADRFNQGLAHHWERIIHFIKLHYVLSERQGEYWDAHRDPLLMAKTLVDDVRSWANQPIDHSDADRCPISFLLQATSMCFMAWDNQLVMITERDGRLLKTTAAAPTQ